MSQKHKLDLILKTIEDTAKKLKVNPVDINKAQFFENCPATLTPWDLRTFGGLTTIKSSYFPQQDKDLAVIRKEKEIVKYIKNLENKASAKLVLDDQLEAMIKEAISSIEIEKIKVEKPIVKVGTNMTMELMLSDVHYGKLTSTFNYKVCRARVQQLSKVFLQEFERKKKEGFNVERIILALLGDLIESYTMHGLESATGCEFGNAQQVQSAITSIFHDILVPIAKTGVKIDVICVTGNHDRFETHRTMQEPGINNLTWIIYKTLEELSEVAGLTNLKFQIAKGSYLIVPIYKNNCLYEHGDNVKSQAKRGFEYLMEQRARQNNTTIDFGRFGHWHEYAMYDRGRIIVNESVCGMDSYAEVKGFNSHSGQTINFYVDTKNRPNSFYCSFPVDLSS